MIRALVSAAGNIGVTVQTESRLFSINHYILGRLSEFRFCSEAIVGYQWDIWVSIGYWKGTDEVLVEEL